MEARTYIAQHHHPAKNFTDVVEFYRSDWG